MNAVNYIKNKFNLKDDHVNPHVLKGTGALYREALYKLYAELGYKVGCEIGVEKGKNAQTMFEIIPNLKLYGVDSYKQHPHASYAYHASLRNWDEQYLQNVKQQCLNRMKGRNFILLEGFSEDVVHQIEDNSLDFVYIDADHSYDFVMQDIILWGRKIRKGGIMSGHDYFDDSKTSLRRAKVTQAVNDYTRVHNIEFYITDEDHSAEKGDHYPSWLWVKLEDIYPNVVGA